MSAVSGDDAGRYGDDDELSALMRAMVGRDEAALSNIYDLTLGRVYGLARAITGNDADAEEVVSEVYWQAWRRAAQYEQVRGPVIAWLLVMCRSQALDVLRRRRPSADREGPAPDVEASRDQLPAADELLSRVEEGSAVHRALGGLKETPRQLVALAFLRGMSHAEISAAVDLPVGTVKSHIRRGLQTLQQCMT